MTPPTRIEEAIASRYAAGDNINELADDYDITNSEARAAVRKTLDYLLIEHGKMVTTLDGIARLAKGAARAIPVGAKRPREVDKLIEACEKAVGE